MNQTHKAVTDGNRSMAHLCDVTNEQYDDLKKGSHGKHLMVGPAKAEKGRLGVYFDPADISHADQEQLRRSLPKGVTVAR